MKKIAYFILIMFFAAGCYYDIDVNHDPNFKPHLSVFSYIQAGKPFYVFVSKSDYPGEVDSNDILTNAQVEVLTQTGETMLPDSSENGYYYFSPVNDEKFRISVKALDMESHADVSFPPVVPLPEISVNPYNINFVSDTNNVYYLDYELKITFKLDDDPGQDNAYGAYFYTHEAVFYYDTVTNVQTDSILWYFKTALYLYGDEMTNSNYSYVDLGDGLSYNNLIFADGVLNGKTITLNLDAYNSKQVKGQPATDTVFCVYYSFPMELYKYAKSLERYSETRNNPFVEPVDIYSNFSQGIGLAAAYRVIDTIPVIVNLQQ